MTSSAGVLGERHGLSLDFEETELRLGLPGGEAEAASAAAAKSSGGKRGFSQTVGLKLDLSLEDLGKGGSEKMKEIGHLPPRSNDSAKPPSKAQVVGWPPVKSFRKISMSVQKTSNEKGTNTSSSSSAYVKVSMDGAPYLRKVDLKMYKSYQALSDALGKMFSSFTIDYCGTNVTKDFMNESKLKDLLNGSEYVPTYEDKDGDWMLVGDVPWEMFVDSCKRLRIMKGSEAIGLAPKAVEKCKNRS